MPPESLAPHELFRLRLEEQLRRDVELLYQAYLTKLRAYETVARAQGEIDGSIPQLAPLTLSLPAPPDGFEGAALPVPPPAAPPAAAPVPPAAPAQPKPAKTPDYVVYDAIVAALDRVGEVFDKRELCRVLGFQPKRSNLHSALGELVKEKVLLLEWGIGRPNRYRKAGTAPQEPPPAAPADEAPRRGRP